MQLPVHGKRIHYYPLFYHCGICEHRGVYPINDGLGFWRFVSFSCSPLG